jgi:hypothetical protein
LSSRSTTKVYLPLAEKEEDDVLLLGPGERPPFVEFSSFCDAGEAEMAFEMM